MCDWNAVRELLVYLGLETDGMLVGRISSCPGNMEALQLLRLSAESTFKKKYPGNTAALLASAIFGADFGLLARREGARAEALSRDVFGRLQGREGTCHGSFEEFDAAFQLFIRSFKATFEGIVSVLGIKKEPVSLESAGAKDCLAELRELPCRRLEIMGRASGACDGTALSGCIEALMKKYEGKAISAENCCGVMEVMSKVSAYSGYYRTMDAAQKLVEARPIILAISELQKYPEKEQAKSDLLSALGILLFNVFPAPRLLKFIARFQPDPENDGLSYEYYAILALNYLSSGRIAEAAAYSEKALSYAGSDEQRAYMHILSSCIHLSRGDPDSAANTLYHCISMTRDGHIRAIARFYMGIVNYEMGNVGEALECFRQSRAGLEDERDVLSSCNNIGTCAMLLGDMGAAIRAFRHVLDAGRYMGGNMAKFLRSVACGNLGIVYLSMLEYDVAADYFKETLKLNRDIRNTKGVADQLCNIGLALKRKHDYRLALEYVKSSLGASFGAGYPEGVLFAFRQAEQLMALEGRYEESEAFRQEVIRRNPDIAKMLRK